VVVAIIVIAAVVMLIVVIMSSPRALELSYGPASKVNNFISRIFANTPGGDVAGPLILWLMLAPWLALFAIIAVHELGHLIAGKFAGFRFICMYLGPIEIAPPFRVKVRRKPRLPGAAGLTVLVPLHNHNLRSRAVVMLLAGPIANLITGFALALLVPNYGLFFGCFIFFSLLVGFINLLPFRRFALHSDGQRILMLLRNSAQGERWLALMQLVNDLQSGVDYDRLNPEFIAIATAVQDGSPDTVSTHALAYGAAFHKHDDIEAARLLEVCLRYSGFVAPLMREAVFADAAIFQARRRKRVDLAEQWLADIPEKSLMPEFRLDAQAAILECQGDIAGALKKLEESEVVIVKQAEPYRRETSLKYLRRWRTELQARQSPPVGTTHSLS